MGGKNNAFAQDDGWKFQEQRATPGERYTSA